MEDCQFSETQFSFCFTFEYIKQFDPLIPLPIFPNTVDEGKPGGGYDVEILGNIYFQFKIPTYHNKVINFFRKHWDVFGHDFYKIKLNTDGNQFKLLKDLQNLSSFNEVYYATPEFYERTLLSSLYSADAIVNNSAIFSIKDLPPHGSGKHHLIYSPKQTWGRLFSEPENINKVKDINPSKFFQNNVKNETIYSQAKQIANVLREQPSTDNRPYVKGLVYFPEVVPLNDKNPNELVKNVYAILLAEYNIHWYPVLSPQRFQR